MSAVSHLGFVAKAGEVWQGPHLRDLATSTYTLPPGQRQAGILIQLPQPLPASDHVHMTAPLASASPAGQDQAPALPAVCDGVRVTRGHPCWARRAWAGDREGYTLSESRADRIGQKRGARERR